MTITFLCLPGFPLAPLSLAIDALRVAEDINGTPALDWQTVSEDGGAVVSSSGLSLTPAGALATVTRSDVLLTFAAADGGFAQPAASNATLRRLLRQGGKVGAVNGAIFALARSGLFDGVRCSVHFTYADAVREGFPRLEVCPTLFCEDRGRISISGAAAVFEYMLALIAQHTSAEIAVEVACRFQHATQRSEGAPQLLPGHSRNQTRDMLPRPIREAVQFFADHLEDRVLIQDAADLVGLSLRQFERIFKQEMATTPGAYYRQLRLDAARQKVLHTETPLSEVAFSVGYETASAFNAIYRRTYGRSPSADRADPQRSRANAALRDHALPQRPALTLAAE
ncbi:GlxA family transcriptional regulator [Tritonibacter scottomollicae]|uniref:AraC family transcriptional regulator with amidase-like domain n=1 Tax=Tritonibacter scottomollicae TaxID=483013 RepID=A0A2T1AI70_TRISK|nr:helix-turn-helix domain-containing protein [Tritonibacter scottomollicae]PRZ48270.1 AraC family transcriptional regulator with amidase-like domain [Tritonibacter scottomollicae]